VLAEVTAREIGRVTIAEALELTALVARKQPNRYGRFAARWLEHEKATLKDVELLVAFTDRTRRLSIEPDFRSLWPCCGLRRQRPRRPVSRSSR